MLIECIHLGSLSQLLDNLGKVAETFNVEGGKFGMVYILKLSFKFVLQSFIHFGWRQELEICRFNQRK